MTPLPIQPPKSHTHTPKQNQAINQKQQQNPETKQQPKYPQFFISHQGIGNRKNDFQMPAKCKIIRSQKIMLILMGVTCCRPALSQCHKNTNFVTTVSIKTPSYYPLKQKTEGKINLLMHLNLTHVERNRQCTHTWLASHLKQKPAMSILSASNS